MKPFILILILIDGVSYVTKFPTNNAFVLKLHFSVKLERTSLQSKSPYGK